MRIFITGGSGFIGTTAVAHFKSMGWEVLNFDIAPPKIENQRAQWVEGDIRDAAKLKTIMTGFRPEYVLNLAATTGADRSDLPADFFTTNTVGVESLIEAIAATGSVSRAIYVSSLLVCRNGYIPSHDQDYCAPGPYGASKVEGERIVRARAGSACEWVIVRPTSVWGPWFEHSYLAFFRLIARGLYVHVALVRDIIKPRTYVGNTVYMFERLLTSSSNQVASCTFYLGDYPESTVGEWATSIQRTTGARRIRTVPMWPLRIAALMGDTLKKLGWKDPPITRFRLNNMATGGRYPLDAIQEVVGDLPFSLDAGVGETVAWLTAQGHISPVRRDR